MIKKELGSIIGGSLTDGLTMRVNPDIPIETLKTGKFVSIIGKDFTFFL
ncbi:MAG: hypothetical protein LVQ75_02870 [Candidatus Babeliales bacterium]|jgi:hypothetical protein